MMKRPGAAAAAAIVLAASLVLSGCTASRLDPVGGVDARAVLEEFKGRGAVKHLEALQRIADDNDGNRASGTSGYEESAQAFTFRGEGKNRKKVKSFNILADTGGSAENTVVAGGHLDSVRKGPGINDNASGVAAMLEIAAWLKESGITPANRVRFAFWGAEEDGLYGSRHYVDELNRAEKAQTAANLNVDVLASPDGVRSIHDGDGSDFEEAGPKGSQEIEDVFFRFFEENSLPAETTPFDGGSDYEAFLQAGIPVGGLFSGDVKNKTKVQVQAYGGSAGKDLDSCHHRACDTISNTNADLLKEMSEALACATAT